MGGIGTRRQGFRLVGDDHSRGYHVDVCSDSDGTRWCFPRSIKTIHIGVLYPTDIRTDVVQLFLMNATDTMQAKD